jgi:AAA domain
MTRCNVAKPMGDELPTPTGDCGPGLEPWEPSDDALEAEAGGRGNGGDARSRLIPVSLDRVGPELPVRSVVNNLILAGDLTGMFGDGDAGKSTAGYHVAVCMALGLPVFGAFEVMTPGGVLAINSGEDRAALIKNRCLAFCRGYQLSEEDTQTALAGIEVLDQGVNLDSLEDLLALQDLVASRDYRLVILDPIADLIGDRANTMEDRDARRIYRNIRAFLLGPNPDLGVIITGHATKEHREKSVRQRVFGAGAWTNGLRACWFMERTAEGFTMDASAKGNRWATRPRHRIIRTVATEADGVTWRVATLTVDANRDHVSEDVLTVLRVVRRAKQAPNSRDLEVLVKGEGMGADRAGLAIGQAKARGWIISPESGRAKAWTTSETGHAHLALIGGSRD